MQIRYIRTFLPFFVPQFALSTLCQTIQFLKGFFFHPFPKCNETSLRILILLLILNESIKWRNNENKSENELIFEKEEREREMIVFEKNVILLPTFLFVLQYWTPLFRFHHWFLFSFQLVIMFTFLVFWRGKRGIESGKKEKQINGRRNTFVTFPVSFKTSLFDHRILESTCTDLIERG